MITSDDSETEGNPLIPVWRDANKSKKVSKAKPYDTRIIIHKRNNPWNHASNDTDEAIVFADRKKRGSSLIANDACLLILWFLQLFSVLQSFGLRWPYPEMFLKTTKYVFFFNLDVWEFVKLNSNGTYTSLQNYYTPTELISFKYWYILIGWLVLILLLFVAYIIALNVLYYKQNPYMLVQIAQLQRAYAILVQVLSLPFGTAVARLFHCNTGDLVDVDNSMTCNGGTHWALLAPSITFFLILYITFPAWLILRTRSELLNMTTDRHEGYLQMKETEYVKGLDVQWTIANFHIFSSFKKYGAYLRAALHLLHALILICYAAFFKQMFAGALVVDLILFSMFLAFLVLRPFRVPAFNAYIILSFLILTLDGMMGVLVSSFDSYSLQTVWLTPSYLNIVLMLVNGAWLAITVIFLVFIMMRHLGCCSSCYPDTPLWPSMTSKDLANMSPRTREYIKGIIICRMLVDECLTMCALFAPAHELARQIHIINAFCRESEFLRDPLQNYLWDTLDEVIEAHMQIAPKSLFAESVKDSIRTTAVEFMKIMPAFKRRLNQREFDFILIHPKKKRLLLKLYCLGIFLNGRREKLARRKLTEPGMQRVWRQKSSEEYPDDGYFEDMYPRMEAGPNYRSQTGVTIGQMEMQEIDDDYAMDEADTFTRLHPLTPKTQYLNLAFEGDDLVSLASEDSVDINNLMKEIPSYPATAETYNRPTSGQTPQSSPTLNPMPESPPPPAYTPHTLSGVSSSRPKSSIPPPLVALSTDPDGIHSPIPGQIPEK
ncbi:hypothetical protein CAPTEDRAFT_219939 [Capitella teleta]|uniref:Uncharacterized protein n=1 Tax=Capitella teleta TaxID=283909 RepID=R7T6C2_CAPTE|nr:hypothetical protein CAPTEDRAFT_219939 [Capitella teleta]|eukprot:ELT88995.1 hypothetical protein CAPTEDRAFT_219939 [Capitella teleta]